MAKLSFDEKAILALYRRFYGVCYPVMEESHVDAHIQIQNMCFLFDLVGIVVGDYGYTRGKHGVYSAVLQYDLKLMDLNPIGILNFYNETIDDSILFSDSNEDSSLFTLAQKERIINLSKNLKLDSHATSLPVWVELLGSMSFLLKYVLPIVTTEEFLVAFIRKEPRFKNNELLRDALSVLQNSKLV